MYRYTLRTVDGDDVTDGPYVDERWLRVGDVLDIDGGRWRVTDKMFAPETDPEFVAAVVIVERA